nr:RNA-directed DNA polymerase, eukaryota, reverse transcriptase zinc-binding domain protein [Tanacetum cinerariifolium]
MENYRTKEDDVAKISASIFVTNFLESFSAKDLFQSCKQYGHVVGTFILNKRAPLKENNICEKEGGKHKTYSNAPSKDNDFMAKSNSFAQVVKGGSMSGKMECVMLEWDLGSLYCNKRSMILRWKGELFGLKLKDSCQRSSELDSRIIDVSDDDDQSVEDVKGGDTVMHEVGNHREDNDVDEVPKTMFDESSGQKEKQSEDPFRIYPLLDKQRKVNSYSDTMNGESLKYPSGFTPIDATEMMGQSNDNVEKQNGDRDQNNNVEEPLNGWDDCSDNMGTKPNDLDSGYSGRFKKSVAPRTGGSILCLIKKVVKVGQTIGYNMEGCVKDIMNITESQGASSVHR